MAARNKVCVRLWIARVDAHRCIPMIGDRRETCVEGSPQFRDNIGQWIAKVFVLATSKAMSPHDDMAAKHFIFRVKLGQSLAFVRRDDTFEHRTPLLVEVLRDLHPIKRLYEHLS